MNFTNEIEAVKEFECYMYCLQLAIQYVEKYEYYNAALYFENAARSLKVLEELKVDENKSDHIVNVFAISRHNDGNY